LCINTNETGATNFKKKKKTLKKLRRKTLKMKITRKRMCNEAIMKDYRRAYCDLLDEHYFRYWICLHTVQQTLNSQEKEKEVFLDSLKFYARVENDARKANEEYLDALKKFDKGDRFYSARVMMRNADFLDSLSKIIEMNIERMDHIERECALLANKE
jgi:hypothetical protein